MKTPSCPYCGEPMIRQLKQKPFYSWICYNSHKENTMKFRTEIFVTESRGRDMSRHLDVLLNERRFPVTRLVSVAPFGPPAPSSHHDFKDLCQFLVTWEVP